MRAKWQMYVVLMAKIRDNLAIFIQNIFFFILDVYLLGGYDNEVIFSEIWRIDLNDMQWRKISQVLKKPVYFHDSVLTDVSTF